MVDIVIVNASHIITDSEVQAAVADLQVWDHNFLRPAYGLTTCQYHIMPYGKLPDPNDTGIWPIFLNRHSIDEGVLGWHTDDAGKTYGRVFVGDAVRYGVSWTVDLSHEAGETRVDPTTDNFYTLPDGRVTLKEIGDPVEADNNGIVVGNHLFTDFVMPDYWSTNVNGRFDYQDKLKSACPTLLPGGYLSIWGGTSWVQITAMHLGGAPSYRSLRHHHSHRRPKTSPP